MALTKPSAIRQVKFCIAMMTKRFSVDTIDNTHTLNAVDISTSQDVELLKGRLAASVQADLAGNLNATVFMQRLRFGATDTVETAGSQLLQAHLAAWDPK